MLKDVPSNQSCCLHGLELNWVINLSCPVKVAMLFTTSYSASRCSIQSRISEKCC